MSENFDNKMRGIYGWKVEDGKAVPPVHRFPRAVKDRLDYFSEMMADGLSMEGCLEFVFSDIEPDGYWFGATKDWLPQDDIFKEWVGATESIAWTEAFIYLLYGNWTDVLEGQVELELATEEPTLTLADEIKAITGQLDDLGKRHQLDLEASDFTILQPYTSGHALAVVVENDGAGRHVTIDVNEKTVILPEKPGRLAVYESEGLE